MNVARSRALFEHALPALYATKVQVPAPMSVSVSPDGMHVLLVSVEKNTVLPDLPPVVITCGGVADVCWIGAEWETQMITVCGARDSHRNAEVAGPARSCVAARSAVKEHVPSAMNDSVVPEIVQTDGVLPLKDHSAFRIRR